MTEKCGRAASSFQCPVEHYQVGPSTLQQGLDQGSGGGGTPGHGITANQWPAHAA